MERFLFFLFLFGIPLHAGKLKTEISSPSAILINPKTGAILFEKEAHRILHPASITKIATVLYALEKKGHVLDEEAMATKDCLSVVHPSLKHASFEAYPPHILETDGIQIGVQVGEIFNLKTLLYGCMLASANDVANVLARHVSGSMEAFTQELNLFLKSKGILETKFVNPHGLHHPEHVTTAYDMALITKEAFKHPFFREMVKSTLFSVPATNKSNERVFIQGNRLLKQSPHFYPKAIGVKTGYVAAAGYNLVAAAEHEGRILIAVVLGASNRDQRYRDVIKLFETAFKEKAVSRVLFNHAFDVFKRALPGAKRELEAKLKEDAIVEFCPSEEPMFKTAITWERKALPILEGDEVGVLKIMAGQGEVINTLPLFASKRVEKIVWARGIDFFRKHRTLLIALFLGANISLFLVYIQVPVES